MSNNGRPNLNGLFSGTTPPDRSSHVADRLDPEAINAKPAESPPGTPGAPLGTPGTAQRRNPVPARGLPARTDDGHLWPLVQLFDPVRTAERYFGMVQAVVDANRELAVGLARAVSSLTHRDGDRR